MGTDRDENGRFAVGNSGFTGARRYTTGVRQALEEMLPPEEVARLWRDAWNAAAKHDAAKSMTALLEFALSYTMGKPKQTLSVEGGDNSQLLLALLADRTPLLPPRQGIIEAADTLQIPDSGIVVDTEMGDEVE